MTPVEEQHTEVIDPVRGAVDRTTSSEVRELWNRESAKYLARSAALRDFPLPSEFLPRPGEKVLDAGCGSGNCVRMYREITPDVCGLDCSDAMIRAAARCGTAVQGDVQRLPFINASFDYVASQLVINHVVDSRGALAELSRVTKPGGRIVVAVPNWLSCVSPMRVVMLKLRRYGLGRCRHYTLSTLRREGSAHDLVVRRATAVRKLPTARNWLRAIPTWVGYELDQLLHVFYPLWGGDLAVLFEKRGALGGDEDRDGLP